MQGHCKTTTEATRWLKELLRGTPNCDSFRAHSLKATVLDWCARAGMDKEVRSVLGHHCSAVSGSEVVYARNLQVRPVRKLQMLLRLIRIGMQFDDIAAGGNIAGVTPAMRTPHVNVGLRGAAVSTPVFPVSIVEERLPCTQDRVAEAIEQANAEEDLLSVKQEVDDLSNVAASASDLTLFPASLVQLGLIETESSSGSESSTSSTEGSDDEPLSKEPVFVEHVPEGTTFFKHLKSQRVHSVEGQELKTVCKLSINDNYRQLDRVIHFKYPKCLRCFPAATGRIRSRSDAVEALDAAIERARKTRQEG